MNNLEKYFLAHAMIIEVRGSIRRYHGMRLTLIDNTGRDILNEGIYYKVKSGTITDRKTQFFNIDGVVESGIYLTELLRFDMFLKHGRFSEDLSEMKELILSTDDITEEEIKEFFPLFVPNYFKQEEIPMLKKLKKV